MITFLVSYLHPLVRKSVPAVRFAWFRSICSGVIVEGYTIMKHLSSRTKTKPALRIKSVILTIAGSACYIVTQVDDLYYFFNSYKVKHSLSRILFVFAITRISRVIVGRLSLHTSCLSRFIAVKHTTEVCRISFQRNATGVVVSLYLSNY